MLKKFVHDYENDFMKTKYGTKSHDDNGTDIFDAELYANIRTHIILSDWMDPIAYNFRSPRCTPHCENLL